ncbi:MAG: serine hydrolase, partial [Phenylobacterium sp.]
MAETVQTFPDAATSDPVALGWMVGSPPPPDRVIRWSDFSSYGFPQLRWSFSHTRELVPTRNISRGLGAPLPLPRAERDDLDAVRFTVTGTDESMTWGESLVENYVDGVVILHRGRIVQERYFGALRPEGQHIAMSVTKSLVGTIGAMMVAEGTLDPDALVTTYVPELAGSGFGDATVRQVLDMTTGVQFSEDYEDREAEILAHAFAGSILPRPADWTGPQS